MEDIIDELEQALGDPERVQDVQRCLSHLRANLCATDFYIEGAGNANAYTLMRDHMDVTAHRFLIGGFNDMLETLIESRLPRQIKNQNNEKTNKLWALMYLHRILENAGLGDPTIKKARSFIAKDNDQVKETLIYLTDKYYIHTSDRSYSHVIRNPYYNLEITGSSEENLYDNIISSTKKEIETLSNLSVSVYGLYTLSRKQQKENNKLLKDKRTFLVHVQNWASEQKEKLKTKDQ